MSLKGKNYVFFLFFYLSIISLCIAGVLAPNLAKIVTIELSQKRLSLYKLSSGTVPQHRGREREERIKMERGGKEREREDRGFQTINWLQVLPSLTCLEHKSLLAIFFALKTNYVTTYK